MKTFPLFMSAGLLCAGLAVGCADSSTPGTSATGDGAAVAQTSWVDDASVTKANLKVEGMT